jgi:hypothetical protein
MSQKNRDKMSLFMMGNKHGQGHSPSRKNREMISKKLIGHPVSDETRLKMSEYRLLDLLIRKIDNNVVTYGA